MNSWFPFREYFMSNYRRNTMHSLFSPDGKPILGYHDLNEDGVMDSLLFVWNKHLALFHSEERKLPWPKEMEGRQWSLYFNIAFKVNHGRNPWNPIRKDWGTFSLLIDKNDDGHFDTQNDFFYRAIDIDGDGAPEAEYYHLFPGQTWCPWSNKTHISLDGDHRMSYLDFATLTYPDEQAYGKGFEYHMNVQGNGFFTNSYSAHPDLSWETPIAWYDFNGDQCPEMVMRVGDTLNNDVIQGGILAKGQDHYSGKISEFELAYELNGNTSKDRRHSLDMQLTFVNYDQPTFDYTSMQDRPSWLKDDGLLSELHGHMAATREESTRTYLPYMDGCQIAMGHPDWAGVFMIFDEDDDDVRWEEMFSTQEDKVEHQVPGFGRCGDQIGDRTEFDTDYQGKGMLYRGTFDGRIHLYHAEKAVWDIDYQALFKGSVDHQVDTEGPRPSEGMRYPRVHYLDKDHDGFIDTIRYTTVEYLHEKETEKLIREIDLLSFTEDPSVLHSELFDPRTDAKLTGWKLENWDGKPLTSKDFENAPIKKYYDHMKAYYETICRQMWQDAQIVYQAALKHGLNRSETKDRLIPVLTLDELIDMKEYGIIEGYSRHLKAEDLREEYHNGFWLREKAFADILKYSGLDTFTLEKLYYTGQYEALAEYLEENL